MRDAKHTRSKIIEESSKLFNTKGYKATSLSDITKATNLTKGAIYRHFIDKSDLEQEALISMCNILRYDLRIRIKSQSTAAKKLMSITKYFKEYRSNPPFVGGCPLMNAAVEADDTDPKLRSVVKSISDNMMQTIITIIENGKSHGEIDQTYNSQSFASMMMSALEGGVMMMKISDDHKHLNAVISFIESEISSFTSV